MREVLKKSGLILAFLLFFLIRFSPTVFAATATLSWSANTESNLAGYRVYYGTASRTYGPAIDVGKQTSYVLNGLSNTTYYFAVTAYNTAGTESAYSVEISKTFTTPDTTPPLLSSINAGTITSSSATVTWGTNELSDSQVQFGTTASYGSSTTLAVSLVTVHSQLLTGLQPSTLYHYRVLSKDASGNLATSSDNTFTTLAASVQLPSPAPAPSGLAAAYGFSEGSGTTTADVSGNGNTGTLSGQTWTTAGKYGNALLFNANGAVDLGNSASLQITGSMTIEAWINPSTFPTVDTGVVSKRGATGDLGYQLDTTVDTGPRTIGFKLADPSGNNMARYGKTALVTGAWQHVAGVYDATAKTMHVYLNGVLDDGSTVGTVTPSQRNSSQDVFIGRRAAGSTGSVFSGTIDEVRIYNRALSQAEIQADIAAAIAKPDTTIPTTPTNLKATAASNSQINLSWTAATDNVGVTGYRIYRNGAQVATTPSTSYSDAGLTASTTYSYNVAAYDAAGNLSAQSAAVSAATLPLPDSTPPTVPTGIKPVAASSSQMNLTWTASTDNVGVSGYRVYRNGTQVGTAGSTSYTDTGLVAATSYSYTVAAYDAAGNLSAQSAAVSGTTLPSMMSIVISPSADTFLNIDSTNNSTGTTLNTYTWPANKVANVALMKFALSSLPAGAVIQSATLNLSLVQADATTDATYTVTVHKIINKNPDLTKATGMTYDGTNAWTASSCCYNNVPLAQADITAAYDTKAIDKTLGVKSWNITKMVQEWISSPSSNFGLLLNSDATKGADRYRSFASMENATATLRPSLSITYSLP